MIYLLLYSIYEGGTYMVRQYEASEVFQPTSFPEHTYVNRLIDSRETYESRLSKALKTKGVLSLITGASKSGKTVLCHSVIEYDKLVEISGSHIRSSEDFWIQIAEKLQIPLEVETTSQQGNELNITGEAGGKTGIPLIADVNLKGAMGTKLTDIESTKEKQQRSKNHMIDFMIRNQKVVVIDDFHYIPSDIQKYLARVLKSEIFHGLKAVVVSLPHRSDDAIRLNPDLIGRVRYINIEPWSPEELRQIPKTGFELLNINISDDQLDLLVQESITSPQLMQQNCLNLSFIINVDNDPGVSSIENIDSIKEAFVDTTRDHENYESVISRMVDGPSQGKEKRTKYDLNNGKKLDIYHVVLLALAEDPPTITINMTDLQIRIQNVLIPTARTPNSLTISNTLAQIQKILHDNGVMFEILEWREQHLHILDPFFLFYIRWRN